MSTPYPPAPRRLTRSRDNRMIGGVCGGVAEYLNMDPTLVRILTAVITLFTFVPLVIYVVAMLLLPEAGQTPPPPPVTRQQAGSTESDQVWGSTGAPWEQGQPTDRDYR